MNWVVLESEISEASDEPDEEPCTLLAVVSNNVVSDTSVVPVMGPFVSSVVPRIDDCVVVFESSEVVGASVLSEVSEVAVT